MIKYSTMSVLKYLGVFILLAGVAILAIPAINGGLNNTYLGVGLSLVVAGFLGHIVLHKKLEQ
jgi:membrane associated rhomboid family serine protease